MTSTFGPCIGHPRAAQRRSSSIAETRLQARKPFVEEKHHCLHFCYVVLRHEANLSTPEICNWREIMLPYPTLQLLRHPTPSIPAGLPSHSQMQPRSVSSTKVLDVCPPTHLRLFSCFHSPAWKHSQLEQSSHLHVSDCLENIADCIIFLLADARPRCNALD